jgi:hypothetical protein
VATRLKINAAGINLTRPLLRQNQLREERGTTRSKRLIIKTKVAHPARAPTWSKRLAIKTKVGHPP